MSFLNPVFRSTAPQTPSLPVLGARLGGKLQLELAGTIHSALCGKGSCLIRRAGNIFGSAGVALQLKPGFRALYLSMVFRDLTTSSLCLSPGFVYLNAGRSYA
jgi:hypothetical protein